MSPGHMNHIRIPEKAQEMRTGWPGTLPPSRRTCTAPSGSRR